MQPTVSVNLPTYDRPRFLKEAIQSVKDQTFSDWELIVVDNASGPETKKVVDSFSPDPRICYLRRNRPGTAATARNQGITEARGRYLAFLDDDEVCCDSKRMWVRYHYSRTSPNFSIRRRLRRWWEKGTSHILKGARTLCRAT